jgi:hypothetical protein
MDVYEPMSRLTEAQQKLTDAIATLEVAIASAKPASAPAMDPDIDTHDEAMRDQMLEELASLDAKVAGALKIVEMSLRANETVAHDVGETASGTNGSAGPDGGQA